MKRSWWRCIESSTSSSYPPSKEDDHLSFIEKFIPIFNLNLDISNLKSGKQIKITRITNATLRRGVGGDVLSHQHPPLILLLKEDDCLSFIEKFFPIFNLNQGISYLKFGEQIKMTRITSAPL